MDLEKIMEGSIWQDSEIKSHDTEHLFYLQAACMKCEEQINRSVPQCITFGSWEGISFPRQPSLDS